MVANSKIRTCNFHEIQPERDVTADNFAKGQININWTMDSSAYFNPYHSYIKFRFQLSGEDGALLITGDNIAMSMFMMDNLFQSIRLRLNDKVISEITDYVPQVAALNKRMKISKERLDNYYAKTEFSQSSQDARKTVALTRKYWEIIWKPPIGFFDIDEYIPGAGGLWNLELTPHPNPTYKKMAIESTGADKTEGVSGQYLFIVQSMNMYLMQGIGEPVRSKSIGWEIQETRCQSQNLTTNSLHQKTFQVHPKTRELTLAFQQIGAGIADSRYAATKFIAQGDEQKLQRFWINYNGKQLPSPIPDPQYGGTGAELYDYLTQRYVETLKYSNYLESPETFDEWLARGPYYHFSGWDPDDQGIRAYVSQQFSAAFTTGVNVLLFDHFYKKITISIEGSQITNVSCV